jgi:DNA repair protein RadC
METYPNQKLSVKNLAKEDRPREKFRARGKKELTDAELLAIVLGSGSRDENVVSLAQRILHSVSNDLNQLGKCSVQELMRFKGIGLTKATLISAALELGRRRQNGSVQEKPQIRSSRDAYLNLQDLMAELPHEEFWVLLLNRANLIIGRERISAGGISGTVVDPKLVFRKALEHSACAIILSHNHPSGNLTPSKADIDLTRKLRSAGESLDISVLDHLIIAEKGYYSFADEGLM